MGVVLNLDGKMKQEGSVQPLVDLTRADMARVNELILSRAGSDVENDTGGCQPPHFIRRQAPAPDDDPGLRPHVRL
ncbi:hypothetical protein VXQ18_01255 [Brucella abortus]|nr:hypothetical protein [Brucella abortus]